MSFSNRFDATRSTLAEFDRDSLVGIGLVTLPVTIILVALVYPFINAVWISFIDLSSGEFVGLQHYRWLVAHDVFWAALRRSLIWTVANLVLQGVVGIGIALLLNRQFFGRNVVRTVMLVPFVIPTAVTAIMWSWLFNMSYGPLNQWLTDYGIVSNQLNPLAEPGLALVTAILINTWRWAPLVALVVFAVLQTIPREEYEAARVEGAGPLSEFRHVTYPHLSSSMTVLGLLGFLLTFNIFDMLWLLTSGGPVGRTTTLPVLIYETAFNLRAIGRGTAISIVLFLLLGVFVLAYFQQDEMQEGGFA